MKQELMTEVMQQMLPYLDNAQLNQLRQVMEQTFYHYEVIGTEAKPEEDAKEEYRNYYDDFINQYHYTPTEYLSFLFWELSAYYSDNPK